ncbi:MAG TPA: hypothetical protein DIT07_02645, partial [Sphingobacteriaceae bacterium]|nr:hypothetical protein [Sphingobacteriaceae bacterium]
MQQELKYQIVAAAQEYAQQNNLTNNDIANKTKINAGYLSNMFRNQFAVTVAGKQVEISDTWFYKLAEFCGLAIKKQYWGTVQTRQFVEVISSLEAAKKSGTVSVIICDTGLGKTYAVDKFSHTHPLHTYKVTVSDAHKLKDILIEILDQLHIPAQYGNAAKILSIANRLKELKRNGHKPQVILDEAENLKLPVIKSLKALYDFCNGYASITLIGTQQLIDGLIKMKKKDKGGVPQFYRRIKASIRYINTSFDFTPFFEKHEIEKPLRRLLHQLCENYGELHDYLEPALREADERDEPLTEDLFRMIYN